VYSHSHITSCYSAYAYSAARSMFLAHTD